VFQFVVDGRGSTLLLKCPGGLWGPPCILSNRHQHPGIHVARTWR